MGGLTSIGRTRLEEVVRTNGYVQRFLIVPVQIPEDHREGAIRIAMESLIGRLDVLAFQVQGLTPGAACGHDGQGKRQDADEGESGMLSHVIRLPPRA